MDIILKGLAHVIKRPVCHCVLQYSRIRLLGGNLQQIRNHFILERMYPVQLYKKGKNPYIKAKNYVYKSLKFTECEKLPDIECILTKNIDGIGKKGELLKIPRKLFRNHLYLTGDAVYPTEENIQEYHIPFKELYGEDLHKTKSSAWADRTWAHLAGLFLRVPMSGDNRWILNKTHIRVALRRMGIEAKDENIILTQKEVTQPGEFVFMLTMKEMPTLRVRGIIYLTYKDPNYQPDEKNLPNIWGNEPLQQLISDASSSSVVE
ncbi:hypothetical protein ACJMK2_025490 [Sinanodonta woodiana]|uniref:Large ribosomal subunit protein bL9m n=1 Tax=Sinanodonta woodiana TaxID=1069815 RepID=A0ABD3XKG7_SINWO